LLFSFMICRMVQRSNSKYCSSAEDGLQAKP
jgi:hypothetical protein